MFGGEKHIAGNARAVGKAFNAVGNERSEITWDKIIEGKHYNIILSHLKSAPNNNAPSRFRIAIAISLPEKRNPDTAIIFITIKYLGRKLHLGSTQINCCRQF